MVKIRWLGDLVSGWDTCWIKSGVVSGLSIASDVDEGRLNCWSWVNGWVSAWCQPSASLVPVWCQPGVDLGPMPVVRWPCAITSHLRARRTT